MSFDTVAILGGGPGGLRAAHGLAEIGGKVLLIEQRDFLGGAPIAENYAGLTPHGEPARPQIERMVEAVTAHPDVDVRLGTVMTAAAGEPGAFTLTLRGPDGEQQAECGAIIIATGFSHFDPGRETQMYGYYEFPDVVTLSDLEGMLSDHHVVRPSNGQPPERVCFIQCVGSRDRHIGNEYCSKVCCGVASKEAIEIRQLLPDSKVYIFYIDMRMYGYWENEIYWPAQEKHHVQYVKGIISEVLAKGDQLLVRGEDTTMGRPMELQMDLVVLSVGMEPRRVPGRCRGCSASSRTSTASSTRSRVPLDTGGHQPRGNLRLRRRARPGRPGGHRVLGGRGGHEGVRVPALPRRRGTS